MKLIKNLLTNSDTFGVVACALCMIHCFATPFLILIYNNSNTDPTTTLLWWKNLDYVFLIISLVLVYYSTQTTSKGLMKYFFWSSWLLLFAMIMNEKKGLFHLPEFMTYVSALILAGIHFYNLKYCSCTNHKTKNKFN